MFFYNKIKPTDPAGNTTTFGMFRTETLISQITITVEASEFEILFISSNTLLFWSAEISAQGKKGADVKDKHGTRNKCVLKGFTAYITEIPPSKVCNVDGNSFQ